MIKIILQSTLFLTFMSISILHIYWAFGGKYGLDKALPVSQDGEKLFQPGKHLTFVVAIGIAYLALFYSPFVVKSNHLFPVYIKNNLGWMVGIIFFIRTIGDFKYVGIFKKVKITEFAKFDTKYFSWITFIIGILAIVLELTE